MGKIESRYEYERLACVNETPEIHSISEYAVDCENSFKLLSLLVEMFVAASVVRF